MQNDKFEQCKSKYGNEKLFIQSWLGDLVIANTSEEEIQKLNGALEKNFKKDNRGELEFLGTKLKIMRHISVYIKEHLLIALCKDSK